LQLGSEEISGEPQEFGLTKEAVRQPGECGMPGWRAAADATPQVGAEEHRTPQRGARQIRAAQPRAVQIGILAHRRDQRRTGKVCPVRADSAQVPAREVHRSQVEHSLHGKCAGNARTACRRREVVQIHPRQGWSRGWPVGVFHVFVCAPKGAFTLWVEVPPGQWSVGPVAGRRLGWVTGWV